MPSVRYREKATGRIVTFAAPQRRMEQSEKWEPYELPPEQAAAVLAEGAPPLPALFSMPGFGDEPEPESV